MARLSIGQKAERVLELLLALRNVRIAAALASHGFTQADLEEGWTLLRGVTRTRLDVIGAETPIDPDALRALDQWENQWFVIAGATLERHAPEVHEWLFRNLSQTEGVAVIVSVSTFLERLELLDKPAKDGGLGTKGKDARKILTQRGLKTSVVDEAKALLAKLGKVEGPLPDLDKMANEEAHYEKAEADLWGWYLEWSKIARQVIKQRSLLRRLGFLRTTASGKEVEVIDDEDESDDASESKDDKKG